VRGLEAFIAGLTSGGLKVDIDVEYHPLPGLPCCLPLYHFRVFIIMQMEDQNRDVMMFLLSE